MIKVADISRHIRKLRKEDDQAYRQWVWRLPYKARVIVDALICGASSEDLIRALAWQYEQNLSWEPGPYAMIDGQIEFTRLIEIIRKVLDESGQDRVEDGVRGRSNLRASGYGIGCLPFSQS